MADFTAGIVIRGEYIEDNLVEIGGRGGRASFLMPDPRVYADRLPLSTSTHLADLYDLRFDDLLDYLEELGTRLVVSKNEYLDQARQASYATSPVTNPIVDWNYEMIPALFQRPILRQMVEKPLGSIDYLEGWVNTTLVNGEKVQIRAFGARTVHMIAGNHPVPGVLSVVRNALTRSDAIIKSPSNDPLFSLAIARTMCDMAPNHPITKHLTVAYWKGGDVEVEKKIYDPANIEKIVAWGGYHSLKHVSQYLQPGLELVSLDPKRSASVIGKEAFENEETMRDAAQRVACDIGAENQVGCVNARVVYVASGTGDAGQRQLKRLAQYAYDALLALPTHLSTKPKHGIHSKLKARLDACRLEDETCVIGGQDDEGAIVVSRRPEPVDFWDLLNDRVANFIPIDTIDDALKYFDAYTQTVGIYPDSLKEQLKDKIPLFGVQRLVSLGYAGGAGLNFATPQDAIEPVRRMLKWIVNESADPVTSPPLWES